jgi:hypothetical protein
MSLWFGPTRKRSSLRVWGVPLYDIAFGPDPEKGELHGQARGVFACGDRATGFFAVGSYARGIIAVGLAAVGVFAFGVGSVGPVACGAMAAGLFAVGGVPVGVVAIGGVSAGWVAVGGGAWMPEGGTGDLAVGYYAWAGGSGGFPVGAHIVSPTRRDPAALQFFNKWLRFLGLNPIPPLPPPAAARPAPGR